MWCPRCTLLQGLFGFNYLRIKQDCIGKCVSMELFFLLLDPVFFSYGSLQYLRLKYWTDDSWANVSKNKWEMLNTLIPFISACTGFPPFRLLIVDKIFLFGADHFPLNWLPLLLHSLLFIKRTFSYSENLTSPHNGEMCAWKHPTAFLQSEKRHFVHRGSSLTLSSRQVASQ